MAQIPEYGELLGALDPGLLKVTSAVAVDYGDDGDTVVIATIKANKNVLVIGVILNVTEAWEADADVLIGVAGSEDELIATGDLTETSVKSTFVMKAVPVKYNSASDISIIATVDAGTTPDQGVLTAQLVYVDLEALV